MEIKTIKIIALVLLFSVASSAITYAVITPSLFHRDPRFKSNVYVLAETMHGKYELPTGNLITNIGENYVRNALGFANATATTNVNATKWISVCNTASPLVTWTQLTTEVTANGFARALGTVVTWMNGTDYGYNVTKKFTCITAAQQLQCAGLQWNGLGATDGNLFAAAAFTQTTFQINDNCTIKWVITIDAN